MFNWESLGGGVISYHCRETFNFFTLNPAVVGVPQLVYDMIAYPSFPI